MSTFQSHDFLNIPIIDMLVPLYLNYLNIILLAKHLEFTPIWEVLFIFPPFSPHKIPSFVLFLFATISHVYGCMLSTSMPTFSLVLLLCKANLFVCFFRAITYVKIICYSAFCLNCTFNNISLHPLFYFIVLFLIVG